MANNSPITDKHQQRRNKMADQENRNPQPSGPQKPGSEQKFGNQPSQPTQHQQQDDPSGQPKSPQSEQEKHDQEKKKQA
jgi:hypothetical protein